MRTRASFGGSADDEDEKLTYIVVEILLLLRDGLERCRGTSARMRPADFRGSVSSFPSGFCFMLRKAPIFQ